MGLSVSAYERRFHFGVQSVALPTMLDGPWPAPECEKDHEAPPEEAALGLYEVDAYRQVRPISQLGDLRFLAFCCGSEVRPGSDLLFWHYFSQNIKSIILRDRYIPSLLYRAIEPEGHELHAGWEIVSDDYEQLLKEALLLMPEGCQYGG
ncbi:MAG: hypothetical protein EBQ73_02245, partial [Gammaproteobacteria bacterium]|nr:hypothetical protein [Gammaproteobacteria bacterium]